MKRSKRKSNKISRRRRRGRRSKLQVTPATLRRDWSSLSSLERGEQLKRLVGQGISRRRLAKQVGCSESLVRKLIKLADAPAADREALRSGQLGVRATLRRARQRRAAAQRVGMSLSPEEREQKVKEGAQLVTRFIYEHVHTYYREQFVAEIKSAWHPLHPRHAEWSAAAPKQHAVPSTKAPEEIIRDCRPGGGKPSDGVGLLNYCCLWFARWGQRVFPDPKLLQDVLARAR